MRRSWRVPPTGIGSRRRSPRPWRATSRARGVAPRRASESMGFLDSAQAESHNPHVMPIYEYRCTACGRTVEALQKLSDAPLTECASCGGALEKLISRTAFQLKGGGWYSEGYGGGKTTSGGDGS